MSPNAPTLLLVDDELEILNALRRSLSREPYQVLLAVNADEALEILGRESVDLLLTDIDMPGMNGLELVALVRKEYPDTVRMLLTGDASLPSALDAINRGEVHRYLTKPLRQDALRSTLREALERLHELRRQARVDHHAARMASMHAALERAHPGIRDVDRDGDVYMLDREALSDLTARMPGGPQRAFFHARFTEPEDPARSRERKT